MKQTDSRGMTLIEVIVSLFLVALAALAVAPMFMYATRNNAAGGDQGQLGALAVECMEDFAAAEYENLVVGGSLTSNVTDYHNVRDTGYLIRWKIDANNVPPDTKVLSIRVIAPGTGMGAGREATLTVLRAQ